MNHLKFFQLSVTLAAAVFAAAPLHADVIKIGDDSNPTKIVGKVTKIDGGFVYLTTSFAGELKIKQSEVNGIDTDGPIAVRLANGTRVVDAHLSSNSNAQNQRAENITGVGIVPIDNLVASWPTGGRDPAEVALERAWAYEASVDVAGKSGNHSQLGTAAQVRATLAGPHDKLAFYTAYDRQVTDRQKSADQFKAGVDFQSNYSGSNSWYVRDEGGFDRVKDIQFYDVAAAGAGYDLVKQPKQTVTARLGLSFRNENYRNPLTPDVNAAGLDVGLSHSLQLADSSIINRLSFVPAFNDFSNFRLTHESFYERPFISPTWKLRVGVSNDYNSQPGKGVDKLDTSYFTRLVLNWR